MENNVDKIIREIKELMEEEVKPEKMASNILKQIKDKQTIKLEEFERTKILMKESRIRSERKEKEYEAIAILQKLKYDREREIKNKVILHKTEMFNNARSKDKEIKRQKRINQTKVFHLVYKVTNLLNGYFYIGVHGTNNKHDSYMGSGVNIRKAQEKEGIENFSKEILKCYDNYDDAFAEEARLVDEAFVAREDTYNLVPGGRCKAYLASNGKLKTFISELLALSESTEAEIAVNEWEVVYSEKHNTPDVKCLCGRKIKNVFYIKNVITGHTTCAGSRCVEKYCHVNSNNDLSDTFNYAKYHNIMKENELTMLDIKVADLSDESLDNFLKKINCRKSS